MPEQLWAATLRAADEFRHIHTTKLFHELPLRVLQRDVDLCDVPRLGDAAEKEPKAHAVLRG